MILYNYYRSSASYRVRIALNLKKIPFEYRAIHLLKGGGEQKSPEYRKLNPQAHVPFLVDGDFGLGESVAIVDYLESIRPEPALFPKSSRERATVLQICEHINSGIQPFQNVKIQNWLGERVASDPKVKEEFVLTWVRLGMEALEQMLSRTAGRFSYGDQVTAADCFVVPQCFSARRFGVEPDQFPSISRVWKNCDDLAEFQAAHPSKQPDAE